MMTWRRHLGWNPREERWRIAALFMLGSACFAIGSLPSYAAHVDVRVVGITFFVGSILFTSAGYSQFHEAVNANRPGRTKWIGFVPRSLDWWSTAVQLFGTVMFNISTAYAMVATLTTRQLNLLVWAPDMFGSIAFLAASQFGWMAVCGAKWRFEPGNVDWWIVTINYAGSIFFMASAIASLFLPATGDPLSVGVVNTGTFLGAMCFFTGAYLLLPASVKKTAR